MLVEHSDEGSDMSDVAPQLPELLLENHALPVGLRKTGRGANRASASRVIMDSLYTGTYIEVLVPLLRLLCLVRHVAAAEARERLAETAP